MVAQARTASVVNSFPAIRQARCRPTWDRRTTKCQDVRDFAANFQVPDKSGAFNSSMQHHLLNLLFRDGVYEQSKTIETFSHAENRDLEPLEVRALVA